MAIEKRKIRVDEKSEKAKKSLSAKKVLYTEIDDEVTTIFDRLSKLKHKNIYLVVPQRAVLFQSAINLKILKRKADDLGKKIFVITNDQNGNRLCQKLEIEVFDKLEGDEHPSLVSGKLAETTDITPLKASINSVSEEAPSRREEKKISISEMIRKGSGKIKILPKNMILSKKSSGKKNGSNLVISAPNKRALFTLVGISLVILLFISYIALPGATLILTPKANTLKVSSNVTLADNERNRAELDTRPPKMISSYRITTQIDKVFEYQATGKDVQGTPSKGKITIKNTSSNNWPLVPKTRFQTADGLVFRIDKQVTVPAGTAEQPGTLVVDVAGDPLDAFGQPVGDKGNFKEPVKFFLPALSADNQKKLFAESTEPFIGGITTVSKFISKEDIEAANAKMEAELKGSAEAELKAILSKRNSTQGTSLELLTGRDTIITNGTEILIPPNIEGQKLESFEVKGKIIASGVAFEKEELLSILKTELKLKKNPEKSLASIDDSSLTYKIIENDLVAQKIKLTASMQGVEEFELSPKKENGERLIKKIKDHIIGKDVSEARDFIRSLPEIEKVEINTWPSWAPNLPSVPENIRIEIRRMEL